MNNMRLTAESAIIFAEVLNSRKMVEGFVESNYPAGPEGMLLFKADCHRFNMQKQLAIISERVVRETRYSLTIIGDAKAKNNNFGLCSVDGVPFYAGCFLEPKGPGGVTEHQAMAEARAFINALRLCRDFCNYKRIDISDFTLHYLSDARAVTDGIDGQGMSYISHIVRAAIREMGINLKIDWIRGLDNLADRFTLVEGEIVYPDYQAMDKYLKG